MNISMLQVCSEPGCGTRTMGTLCIAHEPPGPARVYPRGRPYRLKHREVLTSSTPLAGKTTDLDVVLLEGAP